MQCTSPRRIQLKTKLGLPHYKYPDGLEVPCGKCLACRIAKRREWTIRMIHELGYHEDSIFVTLTYDDDHLPNNYSLVKSDLVKFFKRLRKNLHDRKIKYFACGEYGEVTQRPHYHAIIFGLSLKPEDKDLVMKSWPFCDWHNKSIRKNSFGLAEPDSIGYVAGYIDKKFSGDLANTEYFIKGREPVFRLLSLGIGKQFCDDNAEQLKNNLFVSTFGVKNSLPRYYVKRLGIDIDLLNSEAINKDCETVESITGLYISADDLYKSEATKENKVYLEKLKKSKSQSDKNLQARSKLYRSRKV